MADSIDRKILAILQKDATKSHAEIGRFVNLSTSSVNDRIRRMQKNGVIKNSIVTVDATKVELNVLAFISVLIDWSEANETFGSVVQSMPQVLECHHITGDWSYLLKVRARNNFELEDLISNKIKSLPGVTRSETVFALSTNKETAALPVIA
ncbi:MAG: AsnC family transcriptional regulator [Rhodospirillaceae bacterium]|nr:AsnC family transcriptional regulator [Rhodospirillaceae bacterium]|tara:strand:- start:369 stop:824 length:456 start_codon:yes stop_codon:yes gene_type:complete